ncbi:MAG: FxLYD domain-containing protein [Veillonellales bacterium]
MLCQKCKTQLQEDWMVCPKCGEKIIKASVTIEQPITKQQNPPIIKKCSECGIELPPDVSRCPRCSKEITTSQAKRKQLTGTQIISGIIVVACVVFFFNSYSRSFVPQSQQSKNTVSVITQQTQQANDLEVVEHKAQSEQHSRYIVGTVKNNSNKKYRYAEIRFTLHDESGAQVGTAMTNTADIEANAVWKFKALIVDERATSYKLAGVTGRPY